MGTLTDSEMMTWLNHWLVAFEWRSKDRLCYLEFQDPYGHLYVSTGKDLWECVTNAVQRHPTSLTFAKGEDQPAPPAMNTPAV